MSRTSVAVAAPQGPDTQQPASEFEINLEEHIRAGYQCLFIPTSEEARVQAEISRVGRKMNHRVVLWDFVQGFTGTDLPSELANPKRFFSPNEALRFLLDDNAMTALRENFIFVFRDLDDFFREPANVRAIKTLTEENKLVNKRHKRPLIIISPKLNIPDKLKTCISILDFALPNETKLHKTVDFVQQSIENSAKGKGKAICSDELKDEIVACLMGLTSTEAENALSRCLVQHSGFCREMLSTIKDEKAAIIKKSEVLTYIPEAGMASREEIGGFDLLFPWLDRRRRAYERKARELNIDNPKGIVLLGVPGTGKSYLAKACAKLLGLPGYILDVGAVFGHLVGESEQRMRDALNQIEAQRGCVLLVDEADKAFGGAVDSQGDSGVTRRVFGKFLTWLSEKQDRTFVIMTMNRTHGIPPEFLRAGRFDAVWYTDLPTMAERKQILDIHLRKRGVDPAKLEFGKEDWDELLKKMQDFVGSEIEAVVVEARYQAYETRESGTPTWDELYQAAGSVTPMAQRDADSVSAIRTFCKDRARPVSSPEAPAGRRGRERAVDLDN
jgi:SpoVK/Ycf46/Vps4 family AAA+-type ATPase